MPIWLTLIRIELAKPSLDADLQPLRIGDEEVVADQLHLAAQPLGQQLPAVEVVLGAAVLDGDDRVAVDQAGQVVDHAGGVERLALAGHAVLAVLEELAGGGVAAEVEVLAGAVAGRLARLHDEAQRLVGVGRSWARSRPRRRRWCCGRRRCSAFFRAWKISAPMRSASAKVGAPVGRIMNSWKSIGLSAWAPPLMMFIIGTGRTRAETPPTYL